MQVTFEKGDFRIEFDLDDALVNDEAALERELADTAHHFRARLRRHKYGETPPQLARRIGDLLEGGQTSDEEKEAAFAELEAWNRLPLHP